MFIQYPAQLTKKGMQIPRSSLTGQKIEKKRPAGQKNCHLSVILITPHDDGISIFWTYFSNV
jgi:hypothetical protein